MKRIFLTVGWLAGALGALFALIAGGSRLSGLYWLAGYQLSTILLGSMALMLIGCLGFLAALASNGRS